MKLKKIIFVILVVCLSFCSYACKNNVNLETFISQNRVNILKGETDKFSVTLYVEEREFPLKNDGYVSKKNNYATIKIDFKEEKLDNLKCKFTYKNLEYSSDFAYNPVTSTLTSQVCTDTLMDVCDQDITIIGEDFEEKVELISLKYSGTLSLEELLKCFKENKKDIVKEYFNGDKQAEINIRLLEDEGKNYFYLGIVDTSGKILAYLIDGKSGEILAEKVL